MTEHTRIFVVEDHPIFREGLCDLIAGVQGWSVCGTADSLGDAIIGIGASHPHLVLVDLQLRESTGFSLIRDLLAINPNMRILVLSMFDELQYASRLLGLGVWGYVMKDEGPEVVIDAIRVILQGSRFASDRVKQVALCPVNSRSPLDGLTERELEIFHLVGCGASVAEVAEAVSRSTKTIQNHLGAIQRKLGTPTRRSLYQQANDWVSGRGESVESGKSPAAL